MAWKPRARAPARRTRGRPGSGRPHRPGGGGRSWEFSFDARRIGHPCRQRTDAFESGPIGRDLRENHPVVAQALDPAADLLYARWRRAVDLLWREVVRRRRRQLTERERALAARRIRNLQKIVRRALAEYHRLELERSTRPVR